MEDLFNQALSYLKAAWRYRWYGVGAAWIIAVGGWIGVYLMPIRYEAFARVHVDTQSMLRPLLAGVAVQPNVDQMVSMLSKTLVNRPNLEKVVEMAQLKSDVPTKGSRDQLLAQLSKELVIQPAGRENLYLISYSDVDPDQAKRVVQSLLTIFVESSLGDKRKDSNSARRFIDEQLKTLSDKLVAAEDAVTEFKRKHLGLMPGEGGKDYYGRLVDAQNTLNQTGLDLKEAERSRDSTKKQLSDKYGGEGVDPEIYARIQALQQKLDALRLNYTDQHPDIVAILRTIAQLKAQQEAQAKAGRPSQTAVGINDPVYQQLTVSLAAAEAKVASVKARAEWQTQRLNELKAAAVAAPQVEAEYKQLTRDYDVTKASYTNMLARRATAELSGELAADGGSVDFRVVDPPQVRLSPKAPNRPLLISAVLLVALGGGGGLAFLISQGRPTFSDERRLAEVSGLDVLGTVALVLTDAQKRSHARGSIALLVSLATLLSAYAAVMAMLLLPAGRI